MLEDRFHSRWSHAFHFEGTTLGDMVEQKRLDPFHPLEETLPRFCIGSEPLVHVLLNLAAEGTH